MAITHFLTRHGTWRNTILLLLAQFGVQCLILFWFYPLIGGRGHPLDMRSGLTIADIQQYLTSIGPDGRKLYALNEGTLDVLFPLLYSFAYSFLLLRLIAPMAGAASRWRLIGLLPFAIATFDLCENASVIGAITTFASAGTAAWARAAVLFNTIKGGAMILTITALLAVGCMRLFFFFYKRRYAPEIKSER